MWLKGKLGRVRCVLDDDELIAEYRRYWDRQLACAWTVVTATPARPMVRGWSQAYAVTQRLANAGPLLV